MNYGMPYMGSKNKIAEKIISALPRAKHFYDLFGGGGAMSHCALLSGKYEVVHYNELDPLVYRGFSMAVNGEFKNEKRWISHDEWTRLRYTDPYVAYCFSFGNKLRSGTGYCYSREIEPLKKALHYAIVFDDFTLLNDLEVNIDPEIAKDVTSDSERRIKICSAAQKALQQKSRIQLHSLQSLSRIQSLEGLGRSQDMGESARLLLTSKSYDEVDIEPDSVVYCDPPYTGTWGEYSAGFDHNKFYEWCRKQQTVFISEYTMPEDFMVLMRMEKNCIMSPKKVFKRIEKIFVNSDAEITNELAF